MPKETVRDALVDGFRVHVGWTSSGPDSAGGGHVQIASVNDTSTLTFPPDDESPEAWAARKHREYVSAQEQTNDPVSDVAPSGEPFDGWYVTLDREGINRLIRVLRRARDAAYGADA